MPDQETSDTSHLLNDEVEALFTELQRIPWFKSVGETIIDTNIHQVFTWEEAYQELQDESYTYASFHGDVDQSHPIWSLAYDKAYEAVEASGRNQELEPGNPVARSAAWDIAGTAYQLTIGVKDGFYVKLLEWYRKGHWPCGWQGTYPEGKLIIY